MEHVINLFKTKLQFSAEQFHGTRKNAILFQKVEHANLELGTKAVASQFEAFDIKES